MTTLSEPDRLERAEHSTIERIRHAALTSFAAHGASGTTLRAVAASAGVSLGLVQHHFATKAGLIKAVDDYVLGLVVTITAQPIVAPPADSVADMGSRITVLMGDHPDVVAYLGRALMDGSPLGTTIFDTLSAFGTARWNRRRDLGEARADIDLTWATLNSLILALGTVILRGHIERQVPNAFSAPDQLQRWQDSVTTLLREGLFLRPDDDSAGDPSR